MPNAENAPCPGGTITVEMPSSLATSTATRPPPPPKDSSAKSFGSRPSSTVIARTAPMIFMVEICTTPRASASVARPSRVAMGCSALSASSRSRASLPPSGLSEPRWPSTRAASVNVGAVPPLPYEAGPGAAPALCGPTCSASASSSQAMEPPPAPMVWM